MKHTLKLWSVIGLMGLTLACGKDEDSDPAVTNVDLSGTYTGTISQSNARTAAQGEDVIRATKKSGNVYTLAGDDDGTFLDIFDVTVSGKNFSGSKGLGPFVNFTDLKGNLNGNTIAFTFKHGDTTVSYTGVRPDPSGGGGGGGGGNGFAGPAEYNSGTVSMTVDGKQFSLSEADGGLLSGGFSINATGTGDGELEIFAKGIAGPGTYAIEGFTWDEDRYTYDTVEQTIANALTITSASESSISGTLSFTYDGKSFSGQFTLNK